MNCPFCRRIEQEDYDSGTDHCVAFPDGFPVSPGHTLIVPRRHESALFALSAEERSALWSLVEDVRNALKEKHSPSGFNIGINDGIAAGQTIAHCHFHVIPRYQGDVPDPRGGIRWVLPDRAPYREG